MLWKLNLSLDFGNYGNFFLKKSLFQNFRSIVHNFWVCSKVWPCSLNVIKSDFVKGILLKAIYSFDDSTARKFVQSLFSKYPGFFSKVAFDFIDIN